MAKSCDSTSVWDLGPLFELVPCKCYATRLATYTVKTTDCGDSNSEKGPKVKDVFIKCNECGEETLRDVEFDNIYEKTLPF